MSISFYFFPKIKQGFPPRFVQKNGEFKKYSPTLTFSVNIGLGKEEQQVSIYEGKRQAQTD